MIQTQLQLQPSQISTIRRSLRQCCGLGILLIVLAIWVSNDELAAAEDPAPATAQADPLISLVDEAILVTKYRHLDFQQHSPWQILHGLLALRKDYYIRNGEEMVNAVDWISTSATFKGESWFEATPHGGRAHPYNGTPYDFEGHVNQTLAIIAMCDLPLDHKFNAAGGKTITMADLVRHAQMNVNNREETTWTLWFLTHYVDQDAEWTNAFGERWSMETLVKIQAAASPIGAPCGGCHSLFALAYARNAYLQKHGQLHGTWLEADQKIQQYISAARAMQNRDGSFATEFFKARGYSNEFNARVKSSGHMLEWLMLALPKSRLEEPWLRAGVQTLATDLIRNAAQAADCGPLYHSLHALVLYKQRVQPDSRPTAPPADLAVRKSQPFDLTPSAPAPLVVVPTPGDDAAPGSSKPAAAPLATKSQMAQKPAANMRAPAPQTLAVPGKWVTTPAPQNAKELPKNPIRVAEQPESVQKLSAESSPEKKSSENQVPEDLAPVPGAMPIFQLPVVVEPK